MFLEWTQCPTIQQGKNNYSKLSEQNQSYHTHGIRKVGRLIWGISFE